jgi:outer membrane protein insertion porin family
MKTGPAIGRWSRLSARAASAVACFVAVVGLASASSSADPRLAPDSLVAAGAPVAGVDFTGTRAMSPLALERAIIGALAAEGGAAPFGRPWRGRMLTRALDAVLANYRESGHLHAAVLAVDTVPAASGGGVRLVFAVDEGAPVLLGAVDIVGNELHSDAEISALLGLEPGAPFAAAAFEAGIERLLALYENEGRPYAAVEPRDFAWAETVSFTLAVQEGGPVAIDAIRVSGNRVTRAQVVERIAGLETGTPFAQKDLDEAAARLRRSGLFAAVEPIALAQGADRTRNEVLIRVRDGSTNILNGAIGYVGEEGGVTGLFDLTLANIAGTGRRGSARWEGRGNGVELYRIRYAEPWLFGSPVTARIELGRTIQGELYTQSAFALSGEFALAADLAAQAGWEHESTVESGPAARRATRDAVLAGGAWDVRDSRLAPTRGMRVAGDVSFGRKEFVPAPDAAPLRYRSFILSADIERAQLLGRRWVSYVRARGTGIRTEEEIVPYYELFPLGGATSLRGYREEQFRGAHVELLQIEQRYLLTADGSRFAGFVDVGHVSTRGTVLAVPGEPDQFFKVGYGAGLRLATRIGLVGIDYALGEGDSPLSGKIHVQLESAF